MAVDEAIHGSLFLAQSGSFHHQKPYQKYRAPLTARGRGRVGNQERQPPPVVDTDVVVELFAFSDIVFVGGQTSSL